MSTESKQVVKSNPQRDFRTLAKASANSILSEWVGADRAGEAVGRVATALSAAASAAKNPKDFYDCTPASVATVIAIAALTGIMPSTGAGALAYAIPRSPRRGEQKQLTYQLSHRGLVALAQRSGVKVIPIPISFTDKIEVLSTGEVTVNDIDIDNPPMSESELRGVVLLVKDSQTGTVLFSGFVPKKIINARRELSMDYRYSKDNCIWASWYVEQAMKTAIHYGAGRGWFVIDDTNSQRALQADVEADAIKPDEPRRIDASGLDDLIGEVVNEAAQVDPREQAFADELALAKTAAEIDTLLTMWAKSKHWPEIKSACEAMAKAKRDGL